MDGRAIPAYKAVPGRLYFRQVFGIMLCLRNSGGHVLFACIEDGERVGLWGHMVVELN